MISVWGFMSFHSVHRLSDCHLQSLTMKSIKILIIYYNLIAVPKHNLLLIINY